MSTTPAQQPGAPLRLSLPPDLSRLPEVRAWAWEAGSSASLPEARIFDLQVTVSEATANAIEHAASAVELTAWPLPDRLIVEVTNDGVFQPGLYKDHDGRRRGLGLPLMVSLADQVHVSRLPSDKTQVSLTFFRDDAWKPADEALASVSILPIERSLREVENRYKNLVELSPDAILVTIEGKYVFANPAAARLFGVSTPAELVGKDFLELIHPDDRELLGRRSGEVLAGAVLPPSDLRLLRADGSIIPVAATASRVEFGGRLANQVVLRDITERTRAEEELHESEERLKRSQEIAHLGSWELDLDRNELIWSDEVYRIFGLEPQEFGATYEAFLDHVHPDDRAEVAEAYSGSLREGKDSYEIEHRVLRKKTGQIRWVQEKCQQVRNSDGRIIRSLGMVLDITERRKAEEVLRESEQQYHTLFDNMLDGFALCKMLFDTEGRPVDFTYLTVNPAFERLTGLSEVVGKRVTEVIPGIKEATPELFDIYSRVALGGEPERFEIDFTPLSKWLDISVYSPLRGYFVAVFADITERKRAEEGLQESFRDYQALLKHSLLGFARCKTVFDVNGMPVDYEFVEVNDSYSTITGLTDLVGRKVTEVIPAVERGLIDLHNGVALSGIARHEEVYEPNLGRWYEVNLYSPKAGEFVSLFNDVTERKLADERFRILAEENERLYRQQLEIAENLQAAFLHIPSELGPLRIGHLYRSATEAARVGGDFYDVFQVKEGKIAFLLGDVAGHGIEAARAATLVKDVVHAFIHQTLRPHEVLRRTNKLLIEKRLPGYVTLFLGILDTKTGELRYSSAGHPDMLVRRASAEIEHLGTGSSPLGIYADAVWKPSVAELQADDLLVLFTDGVIEARHNGELFGEKRLETLVKSERIPAERLPDVILDQVLAFSGGTLQDDVAILTLRLITRAEVAPSKKKPYTQENLLS